MTNEIVHMLKKEIFTDSKIIADMLEVNHSDLIRTVEKIIERQKNSPLQSVLKFPQKFIESSFVNKMGRAYKMYELNEQAYLKLAMQLSGYAKAETVQDQIIEAFTMMRQQIQNHSNSEWIAVRKIGIQSRNELTDVLNDFIEYATAQGSKNAKHYISTLTNETYKALSLIAKSDKVPKKFRDTLDGMDLAFLQVAEYVALKSFEDSMSKGLDYHEIYYIAKDTVIAYANAITVKKISK